MDTPHPRARFFNEELDATCPFRSADWRGCAIDPDCLDHTKLPRFLLESILIASGAEQLFLKPNTPDLAEAVLAPNWDSFHTHRFNPDNWSLEYVLYDCSNSWAVLLDPDLVVVGAQRALADKIDCLLSSHGTSLKKLTLSDFPHLDHLLQIKITYLALSVGVRPNNSQLNSKKPLIPAEAGIKLRSRSQEDWIPGFRRSLHDNTTGLHDGDWMGFVTEHARAWKPPLATCRAHAPIAPEVIRRASVR